MNLEFITASHNDKILKENLLRSRVFKEETYPLSVIWNSTNVARAYNIPQTSSDMVCYLHHDVYLPDHFENQLTLSLKKVPKDWEVLGVAGVKGNPKRNYGFISDRGRSWGAQFETPVLVETLDELLLITRGDIKFDEQFPFDFYGADICMGRKCYVLPVYVYHNSSRKVGERTESFYKSQELFKKKWEHKLPITTTCAILEKC